MDKDEDKICPRCGIILRNGNKYTSMGTVIEDKKLMDICKLSKDKTGCFMILEILGVKPKNNLDSFNTFDKIFVRPTNTEIDDLMREVVQSLKEKGFEFPHNDVFVTLEWFDNVRKIPISFKDFKGSSYSATTNIKGVDCTLSISIEFVDSVNEGYLTFLRPELVKDIELSETYFQILEGNKLVGMGYFK